MYILYLPKLEHKMLKKTIACNVQCAVILMKLFVCYFHGLLFRFSMMTQLIYSTRLKFEVWRRRFWKLRQTFSSDLAALYRIYAWLQCHSCLPTSQPNIDVAHGAWHMSQPRLVCSLLLVSGSSRQLCLLSAHAVTLKGPQLFHQKPPPCTGAQLFAAFLSLSLSIVENFILFAPNSASPAVPEYPPTISWYLVASLSTMNVLYSAQYHCPLLCACRSNLSLYRPSLVSWCSSSLPSQ